MSLYPQNGYFCDESSKNCQINFIHYLPLIKICCNPVLNILKHNTLDLSDIYISPSADSSHDKEFSIVGTFSDISTAYARRSVSKFLQAGHTSCTYNYILVVHQRRRLKCTIVKTLILSCVVRPSSLTIHILDFSSTACLTEFKET